ncbi:MAG: hypothetical protein HAW60_02580 [Bdellovibrionales bacterium]|nr:hypothetical protein [Bdellovibrionales bacterium]
MFIVKKITLAIIASSFLLSSVGYANSNTEDGFSVLDALRKYTYIKGDISDTVSKRRDGFSDFNDRNAKAVGFIVNGVQGGVEGVFGRSILSLKHKSLLNKALTNKLHLTETRILRLPENEVHGLGREKITYTDGKEKRTQKVLGVKKITNAEMKSYVNNLSAKDRLKIKSAKWGSIIFLTHGSFLFADSIYLLFSYN